MRQLLLGLACASAFGSAMAQKNVILQQGDLKLRLDTRVTFEGALYLPARQLSNEQWGEEAFRFSSGTNVTQARFGVWGHLGDKWRGKIDIRAIDGRIALQDIFFDYNFTPNTYLRAGYYLDPISIETNAASHHMSLNTPMALSLLARQDRFLGVSITNFSKHHFINAGIYGSNLGSGRTVANRHSDGWGVGVRGAWLPINEDQHTIYIGAYARYRTPDINSEGERNSLRYAANIGSSIDGRSFVQGTLTGVRDYGILGGELAFTQGKFHLMGEYLMNVIRLNRTPPLYGERTNALFHGGYLTASWMLKGKQRQYLNSAGIFSPLANVQKGGSFEVLGRLSYASANDRRKQNTVTSPNQEILFGSSWVGTLGLNWYPNANMIVGINYNYTYADEHARGGGLFTPATGRTEEGFGFHTLQCRVQYCF